MHQNKQCQHKLIWLVFFKLCFSKLKKLMLISVTKKSYEICLPVHLVLASLIDFEYTLPLLLVYTPHSSPAHLFATGGTQKKGLEHFKHVIQICPNRGHIFQNKLRNTWTAILKISAVLRLQV